MRSLLARFRGRREKEAATVSPEAGTKVRRLTVNTSEEMEGVQELLSSPLIHDVQGALNTLLTNRGAAVSTRASSSATPLPLRTPRVLPSAELESEHSPVAEAEAAAPLTFAAIEWPTSLREVLPSANEWQFDVFAVHAAIEAAIPPAPAEGVGTAATAAAAAAVVAGSGGKRGGAVDDNIFSGRNRPLALFALWLFEEQHGLITELRLNQTRLLAFFRRIDAGMARGDAPYHNGLHVMDVMQSIHAILTCGALGSATFVDAPTRLALLLATLIHDYEHSGFNNAFLISTMHEWAIVYNDRSPNENHHVSAAFRILCSQECDFFYGSAIEPVRLNIIWQSSDSH